MFLSSIRCTEFGGRDHEWQLDRLTLDRRNLLVGMNATGKTRALNVIANLARVLDGSRPPAFLSTDYAACFTEGDREWTYAFVVEEMRVQRETLDVDGERCLERGEGGAGWIRAAALNDKLKFQAPQTQLAAVVRRDAIQHPFLQPLHDWAGSVRHYHFGSPLGKDSFTTLVPRSIPGVPEPDDKDAGQVVGVFRRACEELGEARFKEALLRDLRRLSYSAEDVAVGPPLSMRLPFGILPGEPVCLRVQEAGLRGATDQYAMSQGMFRVLSILTLINYLVLSQKAGCFLLDDVGEGLDFERSCRLIQLLREKAETTSVQLVASTNDKFVMNGVPLEEWSVLRREGSRVSVLNHENARDLFEDFRFTGLSNFSFLEMDFAREVPAGEAAGRA